MVGIELKLQQERKKPSTWLLCRQRFFQPASRLLPQRRTSLALQRSPHIAGCTSSCAQLCGSPAGSEHFILICMISALKACIHTGAFVHFYFIPEAASCRKAALSDFPSYLPLYQLLFILVLYSCIGFDSFAPTKFFLPISAVTLV